MRISNFFALFFMLCLCETASAQTPRPLHYFDRLALDSLAAAGLLSPALVFSSFSDFAYNSPIYRQFDSSGVKLDTFLAPPPFSDWEWRVVRLELANKTSAAPNFSLIDDIFEGDKLDRCLYIDISGNTIAGGFNGPASWATDTLNNLNFLNISNNQLSGNVLCKVLPNFRGVRIVEASRYANLGSTTLTRVLEPILDSAARHNPRLQRLILSNNNFLDTATVDGELLSVLKFPQSMPPNGFQELEVLDLSNNSFERIVGTELFERLPMLKVLNLSHNRLHLPLPIPDTAYSVRANDGIATSVLQDGYRGLANLEFLYLSHNDWQVYPDTTEVGAFPLHWFLAKQYSLDSINRKLKHIDISNSNVERIDPRAAFNLIRLGIDTFSNPMLPIEQIWIDSNRLDFLDLQAVASLFNLRTNPIIPFNYEIAGGSFLYENQDSIGIGGIRRRPQGEEVRMRFPLAGDIHSYFSNIGGSNYKVFWKRYANSAPYPNPDHVQVLDFYNVSTNPPSVQLQPASNALVGLSQPMLIDTADYSTTDTLRRAITVSFGMDSAILDYSYLYAEVRNLRFPNLTLHVRPKMLRLGGCYDAMGRATRCQEIAVQVDLNIPEAQRNANLEYNKRLYGAEIIDSCVCGKVQLWSISDTFQQIALNTNGRTTVTQPSQSRPGLKSTDHNYGLLENTPGYNFPTNNVLAVQRATTNPNRTLLAVIDSGTDLDHPAINSQIKRNETGQLNGLDDDNNCADDDFIGYNYLNNSPWADDDHGHGTKVAGIALGQSTPNLAPSDTGVAIVPIKYTDRNGSGTSYHASCGIYYAAEYHKNHQSGTNNREPIKVINASWGYHGESCQILKDAIDAAGQEGILFVCATGNDGANLDTFTHYPSNYPLSNILAVTSVDANNQTISSYANRSNRHADIAAYGTYSQLLIPGASATVPTSTNIQEEGTSFASPMAARAAALLFEHKPTATYCEVKAALMLAARTLQGADSSLIRSKGMVDLEAAKLFLDNMRQDTAVCDTLGNVRIIPFLSIEDNGANAAEHPFKIFPNPAQSTVNIYLFEPSQRLEVSILDTRGVLLYQQVFSQSSQLLQLPIVELGQGLYILQIRDQHSIYTSKFLKTN